MKYAFLMNMPGETPSTCFCEHKMEDGECIFVGLEKETSIDYLKGLCDSGFTNVDLCGDFTEEDLDLMEKQVTGDIEINRCKYFDEEMEKLEEQDSLFNYGIIVYMDNTTKTQWYRIDNKVSNTRIAVVGSIRKAEAAAKDLTKEGIDFIELCSWFDEVKTLEIIEAIDGLVPVGSCGDI